ncbi:hypothetical protein PVAND_013235 [Polypedilum vanderplanki]|uniref:Uncharacterized protein n=1 Tax=Polypedilum vanderplanki TaxID=319348 RepID=A0A9J6CQ24_POLVA|nr:hypothetical protein PVAND_013235 [Polypedilum vanderplanki]
MMKKELQKSCPPHEEDVQSDYYYNYGPYNQQMNFYQNPFFGSNNMEYYSNQYGPTSYYYNYIDQDYYNYLDFYKYDQNPIKEDRFVVVPPKNNTENDNEKIPQEQEKFDYNYNEEDTKGNSTETTTQKSINGTQIDHETNAKNEKPKLGGKKETKNSIFEHDKTGK